MPHNRKAYRVIEHFVLRRERGVQDIKWLMGALNRILLVNGVPTHVPVPMREIGEYLQLSVGRVCQIVKDIADHPYVFAAGAQDFIDQYFPDELSIIQEASAQLEKFKKSKLRLIRGGIPKTLERQNLPRTPRQSRPESAD